MYLSEADGVGQWDAIVSSLVKAGADIYSAKVTSKAQKASAAASARAAEAQAAIEAAAERQRLIAEQAGRPGSKTGTILTVAFIGIGVIGVGAVIAWTLMRKKKGAAAAASK